MHKIELHIETFCNSDKAIIQNTCKAQQMITAIAKHFTNRVNPMPALRLEATELLKNEVAEFLVFLQIVAGLNRAVGCNSARFDLVGNLPNPNSAQRPGKINFGKRVWRLSSRP